MNQQENVELKKHIDFIMASDGAIESFDARLRMCAEGNFETFYAPFEHVNSRAHITIIGLTPGQTQMRIALDHTQAALKNGLSWSDAIEQAKYLASFGGTMRANLTKMLDHVGLHSWLGIDSCSSLFSRFRSMAHHTSILRYPVFNAGRNYNGSPAIDRIPLLRRQVDRWFAQELLRLPDCVFVPLGSEVQKVFMRVANYQKISSDRCLVGVPHPSGANAERIAYFLGAKRKEHLSRQTDGDNIDHVRNELLAKVRALRRLQ